MDEPTLKVFDPSVDVNELTAEMKDVGRKLDAMLTRLGLAERAQAIAGGLTNVELRLMELARALASRPRILLLDETLAGLGSQEIERMLGVIDTLARAGMTFVIIEHTMQAMVRLADRFMWGNDYPHHEGTWPHSAQAIERTMGHLSETARANVLGLNAARFFGFEVPSGRA